MSRRKSYPRIKSDFEGLLSRDDLDETAQAIIAQLQDLIAKQGIHLKHCLIACWRQQQRWSRITEMK